MNDIHHITQLHPELINLVMGCYNQPIIKMLYFNNLNTTLQIKQWKQIVLIDLKMNLMDFNYDIKTNRLFKVTTNATDFYCLQKFIAALQMNDEYKYWCNLHVKIHIDHDYISIDDRFSIQFINNDSIRHEFYVAFKDYYDTLTQRIDDYNKKII